MEANRKAIYFALVEAQDHDLSVSQSRRLVAERFGVSESQVRHIEREGRDRQWPPYEGSRAALEGLPHSHGCPADGPIRTQTVQSTCWPGSVR